MQSASSFLLKLGFLQTSSFEQHITKQTDTTSTMFKTLLFTALISAATSTLTIGKHYTSTQGGDRTVDINVNTNLADLGGWDNDMSRFMIDGEETWEFYNTNDFSGEPLWVSTGPLDWTRVDQLGLGSGVNDKVSSVRMASKLYIGLHYTDTQGGDRVLGIDGPQNLKDNAGWNNNLSRFKIPGGETWEFYDNDDYAGEPLFTKTGPLDWTRVDQIGLGSGINDKVSSVKLAGPLIRLLSADGEAVDTGAQSVNVPAGSSVQAIKGDWTCTGN